MCKTMFLLGAGFTKAAVPSAPTNAELTSRLIDEFGDRSRILKYRNLFRAEDIEVILTRLDLATASDESMRKDRLAIEADLARYFRKLRFSITALENAPWLSAFAADVIGQHDIIVSLNYDCFLEGLLDYCGVWSPNNGYYGVDDIFGEAAPNPKGIVICKIHGSEHFRLSAITDRPEQDGISPEFNGEIFPLSGANRSFTVSEDSRPYLIAPSFVKLPHRQVATMMLKILSHVQNAHNLVIIGCGLRREDSFLWLLLHQFLSRRSKKRLVVVDPGAEAIYSRIYRYWVGDPRKFADINLLSSGLESSCLPLVELLQS